MILWYAYLILLFQNTYDKYQKVAKKTSGNVTTCPKSQPKYLKSIFSIFEIYLKN